jgi:molybdopterin converting factor small subunit
MKISAQFHGILADWVGVPSACFDLADGSTYADLMQSIGQRYRQNMPEQLWDKEHNAFNQKVRAVVDGKALDAMDRTLSDGEEITFLLMMAGG